MPYPIPSAKPLGRFFFIAVYNLSIGPVRSSGNEFKYSDTVFASDLMRVFIVKIRKYFFVTGDIFYVHAGISDAEAVISLYKYAYLSENRCPDRNFQHRHWQSAIIDILQHGCSRISICELLYQMHVLCYFPIFEKAHSAK